VEKSEDLNFKETYSFLEKRLPF